MNNEIKPATGVGFQPVFANDYGIMNTQSGSFNLLHPQNDRILLKDISASLSKLPRFNGHTKYFYSVAQHSILVAMLAPPHLQKAALVHDFAEAYLGDIITPVKRQIKGFTEIEYMLMKRICIRLGVSEAQLEDVKQYDRYACQIEHEFLQTGHLTEDYPEWVPMCMASTAPDKAEKALLGWCSRVGISELVFDR